MRVAKWILAVLILLTGCGGGSRHDPQEKYYLLSSNVKIPYWQTAGNGLMRAAAQLQLRAEVTGPDTYDANAEQQELRRLTGLQDKPSGILVSAADATLLQGDIDAAVSAGIPVITLDSDAPGSKRLLFIGTNNYQAGVMGGRVAAKQINGKGNVVVFTMPGQANLVERLNGYKFAFSENPGIKIVEVVDIKGDPRIAFDKASEIVEKRRDKVDAFICLEAQGGKEVAEVLDRNKVTGKTVVAMDTDEDTLKWIQKGVIAATIAQKPYTMAYYGLKMLDELYHHKPAALDHNWAQDPFSPLPTFVDTGATLITKENVDSFLKARDAVKTEGKS
ncbi:MAG TPA: substrate-binding domain-containing protein [Bryobacteraceae bacterium]|nr:substrate-binding domain-containing protein [Bryobacteraceae bacterium]